MKRKLIIILSAVCLITVFFFGAKAGIFYTKVLKNKETKYQKFIGEVYQIIQKNYWKKTSDKELSKLFEAGMEKIKAQPVKLSSYNKKGVKKELNHTIKNKKKDKKEKLTASLANMVLSTLKPAGRSKLYTQKQKKNLTEKVTNKTEENLYKNLGVTKQASTEKIKEAYQEKKGKLISKETKKAKKKLQKIEESYEVLSEKEDRKTYNKQGTIPTVSSKILDPSTAYIKIEKISPQTLKEFQKEANQINKKATKELNTLILDLRDNIGGSIDLLPYFLGPFIGKNHLAYKFYQQGEEKPFKTKTGWINSLVGYKKVVILVNKNTQSSAELIASVLKKYNVGTLIGETTKGWGTVERVFEVENQLNENKKYSLYLVHHLTLRSDGKPIQNNGVSPEVNINNKNWEEKLYEYIPSEKLIRDIKEIL